MPKLNWCVDSQNCGMLPIQSTRRSFLFIYLFNSIRRRYRVLAFLHAQRYRYLCTCKVRDMQLESSTLALRQVFFCYQQLPGLHGDPGGYHDHIEKMSHSCLHSSTVPMSICTNAYQFQFPRLFCHQSFCKCHLVGQAY